MKVLVVTNNFPSPAKPYDGIFVLRQLEALQERGHEFLVLRIVPMMPPWHSAWKEYAVIPKRQQYGGITASTLKAAWFPNYVGVEFLGIQLSLRLAYEIRRWRPDLIHAEGLIPAGIVAVAGHKPTIVTAHGSDAYDLPWRSPSLRSAARRVLSAVGVSVAVSEFVGKQLTSLGAPNVHVVYNGADEAIFAPGDIHQARELLGLDQDRLTIAFVGRLSSAKGIFDLVEATARIADLQPQLLIAGDGPEHEEILNSLTKARLRFRVLGLLSQEQLAIVYRSADVVALPSHREGLPAVICEAMLVGKTVVATDVGGIPEIVRNALTGVVVEKGDIVGLSTALRRVLTDDALRLRLGSAARAFALQHLTWQANASKYDPLYGEAVATFYERRHTS